MFTVSAGVRRGFLKWLLWIAACLLVINIGRLVYTGVTSPHAHAAVHSPHTVLRTERGYDRAGLLKYSNHYVEALRADGSRMRRFASEIVQQRTIHFSNGDEVRTNDLLSMKSTYPKAGASIRRNPEASCLSGADRDAGFTLAGEDRVDGHRAARLVRLGSRTVTTWYALDAECALLQLRAEHETGVTEQRLSALIVGEPDPALFQVPAGFQETAPSALFDDCKEPGRGCRPSLPESVRQRLDQRYVEARSNSAHLSR